MSVRIITRESAMDMYQNLINKNYDFNTDVCWAYSRLQRNLCMMNYDELVVQCNLWKPLIDNGTIACLECNKKTYVIDGKTWHILVIQPQADDYYMDAVSPLLAGYVVSGYVYWFHNQNRRDTFFNNINGFKTQATSTTTTIINNLLELDRKKAEANKIAEELIASESQKKQPRKPSPPKKEECPLSPAELKAIPPRPPAKIRSPAGSLIDNKAKQVQWDNKYSIYKKWL